LFGSVSLSISEVIVKVNGHRFEFIKYDYFVSFKPWLEPVLPNYGEVNLSVLNPKLKKVVDESNRYV